jgi:uncharacterized protein (DUF58 family)
VLSPEETRLLERLTIGGTANAVASAAGIRRARTRGPGLEFHEYRRYQPGDDPRSIDWTVEARLHQLVVRVARAEGDLRLHVLIDTSASMAIGTPSKLSCATRLGAALCYAAVERRDAVGVSTFDAGVRAFMPPAAGRRQLFRALDTLLSLEPRGASSINEALLQYGTATHGPGVVAVLSDFFEPGAGIEGLRYLLHRGLTPAVVQIVADEELHPDLDQDAELTDVEGRAAPLVVDRAAIGAYQAALDRQQAALRAFCADQALSCMRLVSSTSFAAMVAAGEAAGLFVSSA